MATLLVCIMLCLHAIVGRSDLFDGAEEDENCISKSFQDVNLLHIFLLHQSVEETSILCLSSYCTEQGLGELIVVTDSCRLLKCKRVS